MNTFEARLTEPVEVREPISKMLVGIEQRASRIMELVGDMDSEIYQEANEIESAAGGINLILAGEEV